MRIRVFAQLLIFTSLPYLARQAASQQLSGFLTALSATGAFEVNGQRIVVSANTSIKVEQPNASGSHQMLADAALSSLRLYIGEPAEVFGKANKAHHSIAAHRIVLHQRRPHPVNGFGIIDAVLPPPIGIPDRSASLVRADGYLVLLSHTTHSSFDKPLAPGSAISTNLWCRFSGTQREDGIVIANEARFRANQIAPTEDNLEKKSNYDPSAVPAEKAQSGASKFFRGLDPKQLPPSKDDAMQQRITRIGQSLVPRYQTELPPSDPTRIEFRFQLLDDNKTTAKWHDSWTLPNGIILVPHSVVELMQNDSQIAAVLADSIACAIEKQPLAGHQRGQKMTTAQIAGDIGGFFLPGLGLVTSVANSIAGADAMDDAEDQRGRVSLSLMQDAGYDIYQAPFAWWLLAPEKPQDIASTPLPRRSASLYQFIGESWQPTAGAPVGTSASSSAQGDLKPSTPAEPQ